MPERLAARGEPCQFDLDRLARLVVHAPLTASTRRGGLRCLDSGHATSVCETAVKRRTSIACRMTAEVTMPAVRVSVETPLADLAREILSIPTVPYLETGVR